MGSMILDMCAGHTLTEQRGSMARQQQTMGRHLSERCRHWEAAGTRGERWLRRLLVWYTIRAMHMVRNTQLLLRLLVMCELLLQRSWVLAQPRVAWVHTAPCGPVTAFTQLCYQVEAWKEADNHKRAARNWETNDKSSTSATIDKWSSRKQQHIHTPTSKTKCLSTNIHLQAKLNVYRSTMDSSRTPKS